MLLFWGFKRSRSLSFLVWLFLIWSFFFGIAMTDFKLFIFKIEISLNSLFLNPWDNSFHFRFSDFWEIVWVSRSETFTWTIGSLFGSNLFEASVVYWLIIRKFEKKFEIFLKIITLFLGDHFDRLSVLEYFHDKTHVGHICSFFNSNGLRFLEGGCVLFTEIVVESGDHLVEGLCEWLNFSSFWHECAK